MTRSISSEFLHDLKDGKLQRLTKKIKSDDTLMLAFRREYINVYYRGGSILRLAMDSSGTRNYRANFDPNYMKGSQTQTLDLPDVIAAEDDCETWVNALPFLKEFMNGFFAAHPKSEREFQQLVAWENNRSGVSNETEYFITDIEYADVNQSARLDMLGLKWLSGHRKNEALCTPVFIEMKYGIDAYEGSAGIIKHISDLTSILSDASNISVLNETIAAQFNQLASLDLVRFSRREGFDRVKVSGEPEVIFLLANNNPRSKKLLNTLERIEEPTTFKLRFFAASFAGYGMHDSCMMNLKNFRERVSSYARS